MNAQEKDRALAERIENATGRRQSWADQFARTLRRAQLTLHRWAELECGTGEGRDTWHVERDDTTQKPTMVHQYHVAGEWYTDRHPIPDREAGALRRVEAVCKAAGLYYYHQTDPRGCALYVAAEPLNSQNHSTKGVPCL